MYFFVSFVPIEIIVEFLGHGQKQHKSERRNVGEQKPHFQNIDELSQSYQQEKHVRKLFELVE